MVHSKTSRNVNILPLNGPDTLGSNNESHYVLTTIHIGKIGKKINK
jgi:hypothetical protein